MAKRTPKEILVIQGTDPRYVTRDQLSGLTGAQLSGLTRAQLSWLTGAQLSGLTRDQLSGLTRAQLSGLTRAQLSWLTGDQLSGLTGDQLSWLTGDQLSGLTGAQLSWLTGAQLSWLTGAQLSGLTGDQLSGLTGAQLEFIGLKNVPKLEQPYTKILEAIKGGGLEMNTWHTCATTHCVGGWTVTLTPGGKALEEKYNTRLAAELILRASRPDAPLPNFTASNEAAMAFIEARAAEEAA